MENKRGVNPIQEFIEFNKYKYILLFLILFLIGTMFKSIRPCLSGILGALTLFVILYKQMDYLVRKKKWKRGIASIVLVLEALFFFLAPLVVMMLLTVDVISNIEVDFTKLRDLVSVINGYFEKEFRFRPVSVDMLSSLPKLGTSTLQLIATNVYSISMNLFIIVILLYYLLFKYDKFIVAFYELLPLKRKYKVLFFREAKNIIKGNAVGVPLLAIIQGFFAVIGYELFGVSDPLLYGVLTGFATIIPIVGTAVIWIPLSIYLYIQTSWQASVGLLLYGGIIIAGTDNVIRFFLQKQLADIHPLITLFGVIIGLGMFSFWGIIFGPLILSLLVLFLNIYRHEYIKGSEAKPYLTDSRHGKRTRRIRQKKKSSLESEVEI